MPRKAQRGQYAFSIAELKDTRDKVFYVGKLNRRYLRGYARLRRSQCDVVLTSHRYNHYRRRHPEMTEYEYLIPSVVENPDAVGISRYGRARRVIFSQKYDGKRWLSVVIEIREKRRQHEVITFHFEKEGNINSRERRGWMLWRRNPNKKDHQAGPPPPHLS